MSVVLESSSPEEADRAPRTSESSALSVSLDDLCCPYADHGALARVSSTLLRCESCDRAFPIFGTRPILLDESRSLFAPESVAAHTDERQFPENTGWRYRLRKMFPLSISRDLAADLLPPRLAGVCPAPNILVVGCGATRARYQQAFAPAARLFMTDVTLQGDAALVCDGACLPFRDQFFDCVIIDQVLEHAAHPGRIVDEASRCLKPGGIVYSGVPFLMPVHGYPYDFQRYTPLGHRLLYTRFDELDFRITQGPLSALSLNLVGLCVSLSDNVWWTRLCSLAVRIVLGPLLRLDRRFDHDRRLQVPAASLFIGRKLQADLKLSEVLKQWTETRERL